MWIFLLCFTLEILYSYILRWGLSLEFPLYKVWGMYPDYLFILFYFIFHVDTQLIQQHHVLKKKKSSFSVGLIYILSKISWLPLCSFISGLFILTIVSISNPLLWSLKVYSSLQASKATEMVKNVCVYRFFGSFLYRQSCHVGITTALCFFPFQSLCLVFLCCCIG